MYKTWNDNFADTLRKYVDEQITYPRTLGVPLNPCYGKTRVTPKVERAIFNPPATIIIWNDGTKSVVKCQNCEPFDAEKGFALAYLKKLLGNDNTFNKEIKKWVKWDEPIVPVAPVEAESNLNESEYAGTNIKFNTGDYARIVAQNCGHQFDIGTVVKLEKYDVNYLATDDNGASWYVLDKELDEVF